MEHIRQYDWCALQPDTQYFVTESELDNCVTERILQNKFCNPLISSDEEEGNAPKIDWSIVFKQRNNEQSYRIFVPGLRAPPAYTRLSALTAQQHHQGLRVLCARDPRILEDEFLSSPNKMDHQAFAQEQSYRIFVPGLRAPPAYTRLSALTAQQHHQGLRVLCARDPRILEDEFLSSPNKMDHQAFADFQEAYLKEQQEYVDWAKTLWTNGQCIRALRPKPTIESVYEAEFKVRANQMKGYPKLLAMVAQLHLEPVGEFDMVMEKELISVNISDLPQAQWPQNIRSRLSVMRGCPVPEPCEMHPVRFILPNETDVSVLPITEVYRSLAQYASDNEALFVASEGALRCVLQRRAWALPCAVHAVPKPDGGTNNVVVLGSEFMNKQENVLSRTFRALRHLLEVALVPASELGKRTNQASSCELLSPAAAPRAPAQDSSDEEDNLFIDFDEDARPATQDIDSDAVSNLSEKVTDMEIETNNAEREREEEETPSTKDKDKSIFEGFGVYRCTCQDSIFGRPPPRSFRKWRFRGKSQEHYDVIVHCAHKFKGSTGEVLLEPIPEYQADLGASRQCDDRLASIALSLALRDAKTNVVNVRLDAQSGDIITAEECTRDQFYQQYGESGAPGVIHTLLSQLQGLLPGQYVIQHEPSHGNNALLYAPRSAGAEQLRLEFDSSQPAEADEAKSVKTPPCITSALLPWHKFRKILPCAFTHYQNQLAKPKKQVARKKTPPRALKSKEVNGGHQKKWPKKNRCRKKTD